MNNDEFNAALLERLKDYRGFQANLIFAQSVLQTNQVAAGFCLKDKDAPGVADYMTKIRERLEIVSKLLDYMDDRIGFHPAAYTIRSEGKSVQYAVLRPTMTKQEKVDAVEKFSFDGPPTVPDEKFCGQYGMNPKFRASLSPGMLAKIVMEIVQNEFNRQKNRLKIFKDAEINAITLLGIPTLTVKECERPKTESDEIPSFGMRR